VSWNIRAAIGPGEAFPPAWWRHVRDDRLERIAANLRELDPDVATLQEVTVMTPDGRLVDQPAELARLTARHVRYAAVHSFPLVEPETGRAIGFASWGNAILSREPLADGFAVGLPRPADEDVIEVDGAHDPGTGLPHPMIGVRYGGAEPGHREPRCVVGGRFRDVTVATTHLTYVGRAQRSAQAAAVARELADRAGDGPAILTGDFNAAIDAAELASLGGDGFVDAFAAVGIPRGDERRRSCGRWPIDHLRVRGLELEACRVAVETGDASDHWPIVADLRVS
jgi:endonuclease/exonuclease/phosphatase family metal-dependent hydrolase